MSDKVSPSVRSRLSQLLEHKILLLDGAMGTMIQGHDPGTDALIKQFSVATVDDADPNE